MKRRRPRNVPPLEQLKHAGVSATQLAALATTSEAVAGEDLALPGWDLQAASTSPMLPPAAAVLQAYTLPPALKLTEVHAGMTVTCCVSPEHGWTQLEPFLRE